MFQNKPKVYALIVVILLFHKKEKSKLIGIKYVPHADQIATEFVSTDRQFKKKQQFEKLLIYTSHKMIQHKSKRN